MAKKNTPKKLRAGYTRCDACGCTHKIGAPHVMFCEARTCTLCGTSSRAILPKEADGSRICDTCRFNEDDAA